jgi:hypothetical protein
VLESALLATERHEGSSKYRQFLSAPPPGAGSSLRDHHDDQRMYEHKAQSPPIDATPESLKSRRIYSYLSRQNYTADRPHGRHWPFRALPLELAGRIVMFVTVLRGRAAVTLGHETSLLGPDGFVHGRS